MAGLVAERGAAVFDAQEVGSASLKNLVGGQFSDKIAWRLDYVIFVTNIKLGSQRCYVSFYGTVRSDEPS